VATQLKRTKLTIPQFSSVCSLRIKKGWRWCTAFYKTHLRSRERHLPYGITVLPATWHRWTHPTSQINWYSIYLPQRDGRLSWSRWLVTYWDGWWRWWGFSWSEELPQNAKKCPHAMQVTFQSPAVGLCVAPHGSRKLLKGCKQALALEPATTSPRYPTTAMG